jgi:peptidyl-prolyl cis-trans isomerase A (cyclophilin A)
MGELAREQIQRDFGGNGTEMGIVKTPPFLPIVAALVAAFSLVSAQAARADSDPVVVIKTSEGTMEITLDPEHSPITVKNFLTYVDEKFYDGLFIYRDVQGFVAQGGGVSPQGSGKPEHPPIPDEATKSGLHNLKGTISMARTSDPNSATTQFFLNFVDNTGSLDPNPMGDPNGYAVFGKITKGMDVLDKIQSLGGADQMATPSHTIMIISIRRK